GFRSTRGILTSTVMVTCIALAIWVPRYFFYSFLVAYTVWGLVRSFVLGLLDRMPERDPLLDEEGDVDDSGTEHRSLDYGAIAPVRHRTESTVRDAEIPDSPEI